MPHYTHLLLGAGMTADAAARGIRELDRTGTIGIIGAERYAPYARPPLSKALWKGEAIETIWRNTSDLGVDLHLGRRVTSVDMRARRVIDDRGLDYTFDALLFATGGTPRRLPLNNEEVICFRTLDDYRRLRALADQGKTFAVIGGGFIGSEIAAALALQGCRVTMLFPEDGIGARVFPPELARHVADYFRQKGVDVRPRERVTALNPHESQTIVQTESGFRVAADAVVAGLGITPNVELAAAAGLAVDDGILVDEHLRTTHERVYAAGDVARLHGPVPGKCVRVEHEDNALSMGRAAGRAMAGDRTPYTHLPFFYSDLFDRGYEAVGDLDPRGEVVADWKQEFLEGVVYYLTNGRVRGVLLWNTWGQVDAARALISEPGPFEARDLRGRLPA
ncbi:MAG: NAD(P)/FAD-dependent oxidoreductase [Gemmatimonadota bacterium]